MHYTVVTAVFLLLCTGLPSKIAAWEEVQTTAWEGDTPIDFDSFLNGRDSGVVPITEEPEYPEDRTKRQVAEESPVFLMFANRQFLVQVDLSGTLRNGFRLPAGSNSIGLDYDVKAGLFFWSDVAARVIAAARLNGTGSTVLVNNGVTIPDGIAWDWATSKLYWTDAAEEEIEVLDPERNHRQILLNTGNGSVPRAIVVDPTTRMMYWTDWGSSAKIEKASMDGTSRSVIVDTNIGWPNGLTLDYVTQTLYWCDALLDRLEKCGTDGSRRTMLPTPPNVVLHPFGITFYMNRLYWSDWIANAVFTAPISNTLNTTTVFTNLLLDPMALHVVAETRQPYVFSICTLNNGGCSHLCLLSSSSPQRYQCMCPEGMVLDSDQRTCIVPSPTTPSSPPPTTTPSSCNPLCQNGGQCINGQCICSPQWEGYRCEDAVCRLPCLNGGDCIAPDTCHCPTEYNGDRCEQPVCFPPDGCRNGGVCVRPGHCSCAIGWGGIRCDEPVCTPSCGVHGQCLASGVCYCDSGWTGLTCSQAVCFPPDGCLHGGHCAFPGQCSCPSGWEGERCDEAICLNDCNQHGACIAPDRCHCELQWTGTFCEEAICFPACRNGGRCISPGTCACPLEYEGHRCQTPVSG